MKNRLALLFALFLLLSLFAATGATAQVRVGFKIGYASAWFKEIDHFQSEVFELRFVSESPLTLYATENVSSIPLGGYVSIQINKYWMIQPEVIVTTKGGRGSMVDSALNRYDGEVNLRYLEIPILLKGTVALTPKMSSVFFAGPGLEFPLTAELRSSPNAWTGMSKRKISNINNPDITITVGLGLEWQIRKNLLSLEVRSSFSQKPEKDLRYPYSASSEPGEVGVVGISESMPRNVMVMVGYSFGL